MHQYTAVIECCAETDLYVGYIPDCAGAPIQGQTLGELNAKSNEVVERLLGTAAAQS